MPFCCTFLSRQTIAVWMLAVAAVAAPLASLSAAADASYRYREGRHGKGELKYVNDVPVLVVEGTPKEMGEQKAALTGDATYRVIDYPKALARLLKRENDYPRLLTAGAKLLPQFPADHLAEVDAFARGTRLDRLLIVSINAMVDVYRGGFGCSSLMVEPSRSSTGGPLFGRNLDFFVLNDLEKVSLVTVHRPVGKHAFVSIGTPGMFGCLSGMNDAGLSLATHEVYFSRDWSPMANLRGVPYTLLFRRILEECATVEEAEKLLNSVERTTLFNLALCDCKRAAVAEVTTKNVVLRPAEDGLCICTNHFRTEKLSMLGFCPRYSALAEAKSIEKLGLADVAKKLHEVHQGERTFQTMVFEPAALRLHLAIGSCPSSALPLKTIELADLLKKSP